MATICEDIINISSDEEENHQAEINEHIGSCNSNKITPTTMPLL